MFARIMGVISPSVFLASSIVWGISTGRPIVGAVAVAIGAVAAFLSFRAWRKTTGGIADSVSRSSWLEVAAAVQGAWCRYWKVALFIGGVYCVNLLLLLVLRGVYRVGAWDVLMLWYVVDGMAFSSWVELLRARAGEFAGESDAQ